MNFLAHDRAALLSAALACRAWLAAARPYLFRYVQVQNDGQMEGLVSALRSSPMIANCIRAVRIGDPKTHDLFMRDSSVSTFLGALSGLSSPLVNLSSLDLCGVIDTWDANVMNKLARFTSISSLSLSRCGLSPDELCALVSAFANLRHLKVDHCAHVFSGRLKNMALPRLYNFALTSLAIDDKNCLKDGLDTFLDCILASSSRHTLRSVKFMIGEQSIQPVGEFLWAVREHLENLELGFWLHIDTIIQLCTSTHSSHYHRV